MAKQLLSSNDIDKLPSSIRNELQSYISSTKQYPGYTVNFSDYYIEGGNVYRNSSVSSSGGVTGLSGSTSSALYSYPTSLSTTDRKELQAARESSLRYGSTTYYGASDGSSYVVKNGEVYKENGYGTGANSSSSSNAKKYVTIDGKRYEVASSSTSTGNKASSTSSYGSSTNTAASSPTSSSKTTTTTSYATSGSTTGSTTSTTGSTAGSTTSSSTTYTDVKGLDAAGISAIKNAIQTFVKGYSSKVSAVGTTTATIQQAVKGSASEKMISNLSNSINSGVMQSLNKLNTFANQLDTVKSEYAKADTSNTTVSSYINNINKAQ